MRQYCLALVRQAVGAAVSEAVREAVSEARDVTQGVCCRPSKQVELVAKKKKRLSPH